MIANKLAVLSVVVILAADPAPRPTQQEVDNLVAAILDRILTNPDYLPCQSLLPQGAPISLDREVEGPNFIITKRALRGSTRWSLRAFSELKDEANLTRKGVRYVVIPGINMDDRTANVEVAVAQAAPGRDGGPVRITCCCVGRDVYEHAQGGSWRFTKRMNEGCWPPPPPSEACR